MTRPELRAVTAREFERALVRDGFRFIRAAGSHRSYAHDDGRVVVVAGHAPGSTFAPGTLRTMLKYTKWTNADLVRLGLVRGGARAA
jgi:predicted RNA binding protein YcfA (HicA-like mRNA interferase family)